MKKCKLISCGKEIPQLNHGNSEYCDNDCYYLAKLERNRAKYSKNTQHLYELSRIESILRTLYNKYGSDTYINSSLLNDQFMNWTLFSGEYTIDDFPAKVVGEFAYCLFSNKTVRIWKP